MSRDILESDWKALRKLHPIALDRFCQRVLSEVSALASDSARSSHERYLAIFKRMKQRDREMADAFDDMRRSRAFVRIACIWSLGVLTEEEFARFSPETQEIAKLLAGNG
jgi:hypothetical protein